MLPRSKNLNQICHGFYLVQLNNYESRSQESSVFQQLLLKRAATLSYDVALKLDIGVAVMELLSSSRDLYSLSLTGRYQICTLIETSIRIKHKDDSPAIASRASSAYTVTCEQYKGSHLCFCIDIAFQAAHKRRPRNRPYQFGCALSGVVKNSAKDSFYLHCACCLRLSVG